VSPTSAVEVFGEKVSPSWPTLIWTIFATALPAIKAKALRAMDECIVMLLFLLLSWEVRDSARLSIYEASWVKLIAVNESWGLWTPIAEMRVRSDVFP
jgi:hypothetical protein